MNNKLKDLLILIITIVALYFVLVCTSIAHAQFDTDISIYTDQKDSNWKLYLLTKEDAILTELREITDLRKIEIETDLFNKGDIIAWSENGDYARWGIDTHFQRAHSNNLFEDESHLNIIAEKDYPYVGWNPVNVKPGHFMTTTNGLPANYGMKVRYVFNEFRIKKQRDSDIIMTYSIGDDKYRDDNIGKFYNIRLKSMGRTWVRDNKRYYTRLPSFAHHMITDVRDTKSYRAANASVGESDIYVKFDITIKKHNYYQPESYIDLLVIKKDNLGDYANEPITQEQAEGLANWALQPRLIGVRKVKNPTPPAPPMPTFKEDK